MPPVANTRDISWNTSYRFPYPFDEAAARKYIGFTNNGAGENIWQFAVMHNDRLAGGCGAIRGEGLHTHTAEVGYWLGKDYWGLGLATEIVAELILFIRNRTDIEILTGSCFGWNPASRRVLEKNSFVNEGIRRNAVKKWNRTTDLWLYALPLR